MAGTVSIVLSHPHDDGDVGDRVDVDAAEAKRLVRAGVATYATVSDATSVEGEAGKARTRRAVAGG